MTFYETIKLIHNKLLNRNLFFSIDA